MRTSYESQKLMEDSMCFIDETHRESVGSSVLVATSFIVFNTEEISDHALVNEASVAEYERKLRKGVW